MKKAPFSFGPSALIILGALAARAGCVAAPTVPAHPAWADVAPILRGNCVGCHGWTASDRPPNAAGIHPPNTGGSLRLDFYDVTQAVCGDAALALDPTYTLAGSAGISGQIATDLLPQGGAPSARMPPQPYPALQSWELQSLERWTSAPIKGPPPDGNRPPTIATHQLPSAIDQRLAFTAVLDDPDGDSVVGVVEVAGLAFLMNRPGSFDVLFDSTSWAPGPVYPVAVLCDGWTSVTVALGPVDVQH